MNAQDIMTASPACCTPDSTAQEAARLMAQHACGCLPVVEDTATNHLVGVVTDRDLAVRGLAEGKSVDTPVRDLMSTGPSCCHPDDDVAEVVAATLDHQRVRRCLGGLSELQGESIKLAYYGGYTYPQVAQLLGVALGTVKTRIRDGLIRMRDCMEVPW